MRRRTVFKRFQQEAEVALHLVVLMSQYGEYASLKLRLVYTQTTAGDLYAVEYQIIKAAPHQKWIVLQMSDSILVGHCERMMLRDDLATIVVQLEHGKIRNPEKTPAILHQVQISRQPRSKGSQDFGSYFDPVGHEEDVISLFGGGSFQHLGQLIL